MICRITKPIARFPRAAFTLLEMLVVLAIIGILSALTLPALQGLVGASGLRGGVNSVLVALEQARNAAIENGTDVFVGFPVPGAGEDEANYSSLIVIRGPAPAADLEDTTYKPLSRWIRLPKGIVIDAAGANLVPPPDLSAAALPRLLNRQVEVRAIRYDRFGRVANVPSGNDPLALLVGEGSVDGGNVTWLGPFGKNYEILSAQRLTGRWLVSRP
jgi:prepilin-type N-terminal cleavage/methylation domain-containing protein